MVNFSVAKGSLKNR